jgi:hypothetical protein
MTRKKENPTVSATPTPKRQSTAAAIRAALEHNRAQAPKPADDNGIVATVAAKVRRAKPKPKPLHAVRWMPRVPMFQSTATRYLPVEGRELPVLPLSADHSLPEDYTTRVDAKMIVKPGREAVTGWRGVEAAFNRLGLTPVRLKSGEYVLASPGGRAPDEVIPLWLEVADWVADGRRGQPWQCVECGRAEAIEILPGSGPAKSRAVCADDLR